MVTKTHATICKQAQKLSAVPASHQPEAACRLADWALPKRFSDTSSWDTTDARTTNAVEKRLRWVRSPWFAELLWRSWQSSFRCVYSLRLRWNGWKELKRALPLSHSQDKAAGNSDGPRVPRKKRRCRGCCSAFSCP